MSKILEDEPLPSEYVARFITQKVYYRPSDQTVKYNAFMPNKNGETSVYRIVDLTEKEIYEIGTNFVADILEKALKGRADIIISSILEMNLRVESTPTPHPRHANIINWPEANSERKLIALELASEAELHLIS